MNVLGSVGAAVRAAAHRCSETLLTDAGTDLILRGIGVALATGSIVFAHTMLVAGPRDPGLGAGSAFAAAFRGQTGAGETADADPIVTGSISTTDREAALRRRAWMAGGSGEAGAFAPTGPEDYELRTVAQGAAILQARDGMRVVRPGDVLPGAGWVQSIEQQGEAWVVVTSRGLIRKG